MPNKICPFCKKDVSVNDATCPHCTRILFEKIDHKPTYTHSAQQENRQTNQSTNAHKTSQKEKLKKFFSKFAFWKASPVYQKSGNVYSVYHNKADKFKKIGLAVAVVIFLFGFYLRNNNLSISAPTNNSSVPAGATKNTGFIKEDKSRYYLQIFKSTGDELGANVKSVAKLTGTISDNQGRLVNRYLYKNKNLNIQLFNQKWDIINSEYKNLKQDIFDGKLSDQNKLNEVLNYYKTVYFFTANELWFRAYDNGTQVAKITNEISAAIDDEYFNNYLKNSGGLANANMLVSKTNEVNKNSGIKTEINQLKNKITSCENYDNCGNYNYLIDEYNNLIPQYNVGITASKDLFSRFISLVDVYLIFPGQNTLEQTTTNQ